MDSYDLIVAAHVGCAAAWVGGSTATALVGRRALKSNNRDAIVSYIDFIDWATLRYFIPISLATVVFGVVAVVDGPWSFSNPWVTAGLTMFVISFAMGAGYLGPSITKSESDLDAGGPSGTAFRSRMNRVMAVYSLELVLLYATIAVMVLKPS